MSYNQLKCQVKKLHGKYLILAYIYPQYPAHFHIDETRYLEGRQISQTSRGRIQKYILGTKISLLWSMKSSRIVPGLSWMSTSLQYTHECSGFKAVYNK